MEKARILEKLGRPHEAAAALRGYLALRSECEDALRPELEEARRRLEALEPAQAKR